MRRFRATHVLLAALALLPGCESPSANGGVEVLAFGASWCRECVANKPAVAKIAQKYRVRRYDDPQEHGRFGVSSLPTYVVRVNGVEQMRTGDIRQLAAALGVQL